MTLPANRIVLTAGYCGFRWFTQKWSKLQNWKVFFCGKTKKFSPIWLPYNLNFDFLLQNKQNYKLGMFHQICSLVKSVVIVFVLFLQHDQLIDGPTDWLTDQPNYRAACTRLKMISQGLINRKKDNSPANLLLRPLFSLRILSIVVSYLLFHFTLKKQNFTYACHRYTPLVGSNTQENQGEMK